MITCGICYGSQLVSPLFIKYFTITWCQTVKLKDAKYFTNNTYIMDVSKQNPRSFTDLG
mgnify:CR=1 FL=1